MRAIPKAKKVFKGSVSNKHNKACSDTRKKQKEEHGYNFCEICMKNENHSKTETHHIYFASRVPKHKNLHNELNLVIVCRPCHLKFHNGKEYNEKFLELESDRGLIDLFRTS